MAGLAGYAGPMLRKGIFDRLYPGSVVDYEVIPIEEAFPDGHHKSEGQAIHAIRCTIIKADGTYCVGVKEIDLREKRRDGKWYDIDQTPEQFTKDQTKAMGRALRDGGIPQKLDELMVLNRIVLASLGVQAPTSRKGGIIDADGEIHGSTDPDGDDEADGGDDELTLEEQVALRFKQLNGADKLSVSKLAKDQLGVTNVLRAGEHAEAIWTMLEELHTPENEGPDE